MATLALAGPWGRSEWKPLAGSAPPSTAAVTLLLAAGQTSKQLRCANLPQPATPLPVASVLGRPRRPEGSLHPRRSRSRADPVAGAATTGRTFSPSRGGAALIGRAAAPRAPEGQALTTNTRPIDSRDSYCPAPRRRRESGHTPATTPRRPLQPGASCLRHLPWLQAFCSATPHLTCRWRTLAANPDLRRKMAAAA